MWAQKEYVPFAVEGKTWHCVQTKNIFEQTPVYEYDVFIQGDTVIKGKPCKKVYVNTVAQYKAALYEDGRRVYSVDKGTEEFWLLYDFNVTVGDTLCYGINEWDMYEVYLDEIVVIEGVPLRKIAFCSEEWGEGAYIESLGGLGDPLARPIVLLGNTPYLERCTLNGTILYQFHGNTDKVNSITNMLPSTIYYNLQGQKQKQLRKGVNIIRKDDGTTRKVLIK